MKTLTDQLAGYAAYHRDRRNIVTHLVGIPVIVLAVVVLLSRPVLADAGGVPVTPALLVSAAACAYWLALDRPLGAVMVAAVLAMLAIAAPIAAASTGVWLGWGLGLFVAGWIVQFVGHWYEGRKPAFLDDVVGLLIGPLFVAAEVAFALGARRALQAEIERRVGPTVVRARGGAAA
ncbi:MAG TPA: Mpo1-like protein [Burkholderiaceae bacterium]|nr:Mpo1-like protein [Burkholderiaceae bacterium]